MTIRAHLCLTVASAFALTQAASAVDVFDDFSSGNDNAWTHLDYPNLFLGIPSSYTVANGQYRIAAPSYPNIQAFLPAVSTRVDTLATDSRISVDITDWNDATNNTMRVYARGVQFASGATQYYSLAFFPTSAAGPGLSNFRVERGNADGTVDLLTPLEATVFPIVDPTHIYQMAFTLEGPYLRGDLFDLTTNPSAPLRTLLVTDSGPRALLGPGTVSLGVGANIVFPNAPVIPGAAATFDNFRVIPAPSAAALLGLGGLLAARRRRA